MNYLLKCSINRYYDPATDQFLSIDPDVATTDQPYLFTGDDPLNATDPLGLWSLFHAVASGFDSVRHSVAATANWIANHPLQVLGGVAIFLGVVSGLGIFVAADMLIDAVTVEALSASEAADAAAGTDSYSSALDALVKATTEAAKTTAEVVTHAAPILLGVSAPLVGVGYLLVTIKPVAKKPVTKSNSKK
jgi:uncharacterized protein RhaS with RHS repeats